MLFKRLFTFASSLIIAASLSLPCMAQSAELGVTDAPLTISDPLKLIEQLGDEDFLKREFATQALMLHPDLNDGLVAQAMQRATLPEVKQRLIRVAMHRFFANIPAMHTTINSTKGAVGMNISTQNIVHPTQHPMLTRPAVIVTETRPGFPAFVYLRTGDLITGIDGRPFDDNLDYNDFVEAIKVNRPGEIMRMNIIRHGQQIVVPVKLDSLDRLNQVSEMTGGMANPTLYLPWRRHLGNLLNDAETGRIIDLDSAPISH